MRNSTKLLALSFILVIVSSSVLGLTASIGNARMVIRLNVGEEIEKYVLVKNVNNVSVNINVSASGDLEKYIKIKDNNFVLEPEEEKKAYFTISPKKNGTFETLIRVSFTPAEGKDPGAGLASTVIVIVSGASEEDETNSVLDSINISGTIQKLFGKKSEENSNLPLLILTSTIVVLVVVLLVLLAKKRRRKNVGDIHKTKKQI